MKDVKISIIIPIYGVEKYIENSLMSIVNQSFKNYEIILVDDGSLDNSIQLAESMLGKTRIAYKIFKQANSGQGIARENGVKLATADWIMFFDPDDVINPFALENMISLLDKEANCDLIFSNFQYFNLSNDLNFENKCLTYKNYSREEILEKYLKREIRMLLPGTIIKRDLFIKNEIKVDEESRYSEDVYLLWLLLYHSKKIIYVNNKYYHYLIRPNSTMTGANLNRVLSGYNSIDNLLLKLERIDCKSNINFYIKPRWILGMMNSAAKIMEYDDFRGLSMSMNYKVEMKKLYTFPELRTRILAFLFFNSINFTYKLINLLYSKGRSQ